jgi:hypothetical protein
MPTLLTNILPVKISCDIPNKFVHKMLNKLLAIHIAIFTSIINAEDSLFMKN